MISYELTQIHINFYELMSEISMPVNSKGAMDPYEPFYRIFLVIQGHLGSFQLCLITLT